MINRQKVEQLIYLLREVYYYGCRADNEDDYKELYYIYSKLRAEYFKSVDFLRGEYYESKRIH